MLSNWPEKCHKLAVTSTPFPAPFPDDNEAYRFPVSVKGVVVRDGQVALLKNGRDEWELPGGKLELGEAPTDCVAREIEEELALGVKVGPVIDAWVYHIAPGVDVLIVTYGCHPEPFERLTHSPEHKQAGLFRLEEVEGLNMPDGYKASIWAWSQVLAGESPA